MKTTISFFCLLLFISISSFGQNLEWLYNISGAENKLFQMEVDNEGDFVWVNTFASVNNI